MNIAYAGFSVRVKTIGFHSEQIIELISGDDNESTISFIPKSIDY